MELVSLATLSTFLEASTDKDQQSMQEKTLPLTLRPKSGPGSGT